ncbi:nucleoside-diphosphate sugar epimerase/dehydratase [Enterovirga sp.]|uniref:nucleoside-diphosphate sugar epimerase/dehydratase n=1 Tax=Enterovirga sp. TaxID=2026350 RepID=UPI00260F732A|nr:nucleoside-diphosphate sugar epimerase/dehydratase [Enterovirga sp.]MDB5591097.1 putative nucleoside-diphosphate sugar epimerase [Enterovirga sp.]
MNLRRLIIGGHDVGMTAVALLASFYLRWGSPEFWLRLDTILLVCAAAMPIALVAYWLFRLPRSPWRFVSIADLGRIAAASAIPAVFLALTDFLARGEVIVPRTVPVIYWLVQIALLAGPRVLYRTYRSRRRDRRALRGAYRMPVLIAGSDDEADQLIRRLRRDAVTSLEPVAILTSKQRHLGERIHGVPIMGSLGDLDEVMRQLEIRHIKPRRLVILREVLTGPGVDGLLGAARRLGIATVRVTQSMAEIGQEGDSRLTLAPVSIDDLLGRSSREADLADVRALVGGRAVLVTGAGGSIGSELCRQIAEMGPARLMLLDQSELALWSVARELRSRDPGLALVQHLGSVCDAGDLGRAFSTFRPDLVFHAAALKHVDIVEAHPVAAAATNTLGTQEVAREAARVGAACAVFISTDKAVDPVSVLGATKRAGELVFADADRQARKAGAPTRFFAVRFGNVLGSSGSVIPLFTEQLKAGGPITVTHPDVERYFMTIQEAVTLVLLASAEGVRSPETSPTFVLDMGQPVRIVDLARRMIRLAGLEPDVDVEIRFTGLRPGERLSEILESQGEALHATAIAGVRATDPRLPSGEQIEAGLERLRSAVLGHDAPGVVAALRALVAEYRPVLAQEDQGAAGTAGEQPPERLRAVGA